MKTPKMTLVTGGTGKTGRRIIERLNAHGFPVRVGSRSGESPFDWDDRSTWAAVLQDVQAVYIAYFPDLAVPGATDTIRAFTDQAIKSGVSRIVLLSGRGEEEAQRCERIVQDAGDAADVDWTIVRAGWFAQNFSEGFMADMVNDGTVALPADGVQEPFVDVDDIADVAFAALTEDGHSGELYELTGPRLMTFAEAVAEIGEATGREINYVPIPREAFKAGMVEQGVPADFVWLVDYLFTEVLNGHNAYLTDGVKRALGREPRSFGQYAEEAAADGAWAPLELQVYG